MGLTACTEKPEEPSHIHQWSTAWKSDDTAHWHACTDPSCTEKNGYAEHDFTHGDCVCGEEKPAEPVDPEPTPSDEFKVEDNIEKLMQELDSTLKLLNLWAAGNNAEIQDVKRIYLNKSENSNFIDSIGAVFTTKANSEKYFKVSELKLPVKKDLTYEEICNSGLQYEPGATSVKNLYSISLNEARERQYQDTANIVKSQIFEENFTSADWSCWIAHPDMTTDVHTVVILNQNYIDETSINIYHKYGVNMIDVVKQSFEGKESSSSTYTIRNHKTVNIPYDSLNITKLLQQT